MAPGALTLKLDATAMYTREQANELAYHVACELSVYGVETFTVLPPGAKR